MTTTTAAAAAREDVAGAELVAPDEMADATRAELARRRAAIRAVSDDLLALAAAGPTGDPQRAGDVAGAWLMEFTSANTRQ